jgi:thiol-disulfide isomerase/thioredoxin
LEKYAVLKQTVKTHYCLSIGAVVLMLTVAITLNGCKETTSQPATNGASESNTVQTPSQAPAKADNPTTAANQTPADNPTPADAAKPQPVAPAQEHKNLIDVIRSAKTWGPAREFMPMIGKEAPDFTLTDINGKQHKLSDYRGRNVILKFWATWCPPCKMTVPHLIELRKTVGEDKLAIMALSYVSSYPPNTAEMIKDFATSKKLNYPVFAIGSEGAWTLYDSVNSLPTVFFIDTEGRIKLVTSGLIPLDDFKAILEAQWPEGSI